MTKLPKLIVAVLLLFTGSTLADETHGWAVVYKKNVVNPNQSYAMFCTTSPGCNTVYMDVEETMWFPTRERAFDFINGFYVEVGAASGWISHTNIVGDLVGAAPMPADRIVGIYECKRVTFHLQKVGTHKVVVQEPKEVDKDVMEWKP